MSLNFIYFMTVIALGSISILLTLAEKTYRDGMPNRVNKPQKEASQLTVPYDDEQVVTFLANFLSRRWHRVDYFDSHRNVILFSNVFSRYGFQFCDLRVSPSESGGTTISVHVGTKFGFLKSDTRRQLNQMALSMLHAAILGAAPARAGVEAGTVLPAD